jgi:general secretion pathway protein N
MTGRDTMQRLAIRLTLLVASALAVPASTAALTADVSDIDADAPRRADLAAAPPLWEHPAAAAPVMVVVGPAEPPPAPPVPARSANPLWAIPLTTLSTTRERPILSASRRPPPPAVAQLTVTKPPPAPKPARVERPRLSLVGTIAGSDQSFAIFVDQATKAVLRLKIGEDYQGWRLSAVQGRETTLMRDQQTIMLSLPQPGTVTSEPVRVEAANAVMQGAVATPQRGGKR